MSFLQKLDMVKLSDNQTYVLAEMINENNIDYLMLIKADENGEMTEEVVYGKIVVLPTRKYGIETIEDKELKAHLAKIFLPMFKEDYEQ